jgi:hypothetical protein
MHSLTRCRSLLAAVAAAVVLYGGLGLAPAPARADDRRDRDDHGRDYHHARDYHHGRDYHHDRDYRRDDWRHQDWGYSPIYAPPPIYVPSAQPAPGINLIIPFHIH